MATAITEKTLSQGVKVLKKMSFIFTDYDSTDIIERKGKFELLLRNGIMGDDGVYREAIPNIDDDPTLKLSQEQTKLLMADSVTLASGKTISGAEYAECTGMYIDKIWSGVYKVEEVIDELPI